MQPVPPEGIEGNQPSTPAPPKRSGKKILLIVVISVLGFLIIAGVATGIFAWRFNNGWRSIVIENVDLARIPHGVYEGEAKNFHDSAKVRVTVQDHRMAAIEILKNSPSGNNDEMEQLAERIIASQSPDVDVISGSSASSKVLLKAVDNALVDAQS